MPYVYGCNLTGSKVLGVLKYFPVTVCDRIGSELNLYIYKDIFIFIITVTYRRDRGVREAYEERFLPERPVSVYFVQIMLKHKSYTLLHSNQKHATG